MCEGDFLCDAMKSPWNLCIQTFIHKKRKHFSQFLPPHWKISLIEMHRALKRPRVNYKSATVDQKLSFYTRSLSLCALCPRKAIQQFINHTNLHFTCCVRTSECMDMLFCAIVKKSYFNWAIFEYEKFR